MFKVSETKKHTFDFEYKDKTYSLPAVETIPYEQIMSLQDGGVEAWDELLRKHAPGFAKAATVDELNQVTKAWRDESTVDAGESGTSSD